MKRLIALVLTIGVLFCSIGMTVLAEEAKLTMKAEDCAPGSTITLSFGLQAGSNIAAANFEVTYDTDTFEYSSYDTGDLVSNSLAVGNASNGKFLFATAGTTPITEAGTLFTIEFLVDSSASGEHTFYFYTTSCCDENMSEIKVERISSTVTVAGEAVSQVSVTPVTSTASNGSKVTVSADNGESATGLVVGSSDNNSKAAGKKDSSGSSRSWVIVLVVIVVAGLIAALLIAAVLRAKKNDRQEDNQSILDEEAKRMLDLSSDALEDNEADDSNDE